MISPSGLLSEGLCLSGLMLSEMIAVFSFDRFGTDFRGEGFSLRRGGANRVFFRLKIPRPIKGENIKDQKIERNFLF